MSILSNPQSHISMVASFLNTSSSSSSSPMSASPTTPPFLSLCGENERCCVRCCGIDDDGVGSGGGDDDGDVLSITTVGVLRAEPQSSDVERDRSSISMTCGCRWHPEAVVVVAAAASVDVAPVIDINIVDGVGDNEVSDDRRRHRFGSGFFSSSSIE